MQYIRNDWTESEVNQLLAMPFMDLIFKSSQTHREFHGSNKVQLSSLLSIKTGSCPEDCKYCPQSAHYKTDLKKEPLMEMESIKSAAKLAKENGATRFCMGAAWRKLHDRDMDYMCNIVKEIKNLGLETCMTLGMITKNQASALKNAGLDYYNHNIDTSEEYYKKIITTRTYEDRLNTLANVRESGLNVCCGGIIGMGEEKEDRIKMLITLANMEKHPESVPINMLVKVGGTPLESEKDFDIFEYIKIIALARIMMPKSFVRISAGRSQMSDEAQALCFIAGANSVFFGEKLLTTSNPEENEDLQLFKKLGIEVFG